MSNETEKKLLPAGNIMIIDDQFPDYFEDISKKENENENKEIKNFNDLIKFSKTNGFPLIPINKTENIVEILDEVNKYSNVRLLFLDLYLDPAMDTTEGPNEHLKTTISQIILKAYKKFGYFFLVINSAHSEEWSDIKDFISNDYKDSQPGLINLLEHLTVLVDKTTHNLYDKITKKVLKNYSISLITQFEYFLNQAKDNTFHNFIDYNAQTWTKFISIIDEQSGDNLNHILNGIFIDLLKCNIDHDTFKSLPTHAYEEQSSDSSLVKQIFKSINYVYAKEHNQEAFSKSWSGNIYKLKENYDVYDHAAIITPVCDIAQKKCPPFKILYGVEITEENKNNYIDIASAGKKDKKKYQDIKEVTNTPADHLVILPFITNNNHSIVFDLRQINSSNFDTSLCEFICRLTELRFSDLLDKIAKHSSRKGFLPFPLKGIKHL